ncbi:MAG: PH domain-containing protein [Geodermatophilaceae bacterium]
MQPEPNRPIGVDPNQPTQGGPESNDSTQGRPDSGEGDVAAAGVEGEPGPARTSPKVIAIHALTIRGLREAIPGLVAAFAWLQVSGGVRSFGIVGILLAAAAALVGLAALSWYRFTYQVANRQLIISQGIFSRRVRTIPVDRIRAIDSQVSPLHRVLGLARLKIEAAAAGTGNEEAEIDGLPTETAAVLRGDLLRARRRPAASAASSATGADRDGSRTTEAGPRPAGAFDAHRRSDGHPGEAGTELLDEPLEEVEYSRSRLSWLLYAPLVGSYLAIPLAGLGFLSQFVDDLPDSWFSWANLDPSTFSAADFTLAGLGLVALLAIGAVIGAVFLNWRFLLVKRGELMVSERGLLTRRTVSVEIPRIRGYTLSEGLGMRLVRAARLTALITGVSTANSRSQLLPLGPRREAVDVAERAVRRFDSPLRRHPPAALRRRLVRAVLPGAAVLVTGLILGVVAVIIVGVALTILGIPLGIDRYRSLGHGSDRDSFAVRSGSLVRQTTVMQRRAVVGWKIQRSFFQKRAGVSTVTALVGAGTGAYSALDAASTDALDLAANNGGRWARELRPQPEAHR